MSDLVVRIRGDGRDAEAALARVNDGVQRVARESQQASSILQGSTSRWSGAFSAASAALAPLIAGLAGGTFVATLRDTVAAMDDLGDAAPGLGLLASELSSFQLSARAAGLQSGDLSAALSRLNKQATEAAGGNKQARATFDAMGVSVTDAGGRLRSTAEILRDVADRFASYANGTEKSALAQELFGKSGAKLIAFLNEGREGLQKFGGASEEQIRVAAELQSRIDRLAAAWDRLKMSIAGAVAGAIVGVEQSTQQQIQALEYQLQRLEENLQNPRFRKNPAIFEQISRKVLETRGQLEGLRSAIEEAAKAPAGAGGDRAPIVGIIETASKAAKEASFNLAEYQRGIQAAAEAEANWETQPLRDRIALIERLERVSGIAASRDLAAQMADIDRAFFDGIERPDGSRFFLSPEQYDAALRNANGLRTAFGEAAKESRDAGKEIGEFYSALGRGIEDSLVRAMQTGKLRFADLLQDMAAQLIRSGLRELIQGLFTSGVIQEGLAALIGAFAGARAMGGPVLAGSAYLVGERGPELFVPGSAGQVVPNHALRAAPAAAPRVSVTVHNHAPVQVRQQAREDGQGGISLDVVIEAVEHRIAANVAGNRGTLAGALQGRFGLRNQVR